MNNNLRIGYIAGVTLALVFLQNGFVAADQFSEVTVTDGNVQINEAQKGVLFKNSSSGDSRLINMTNGVPHFYNSLVDGLRFDVGDQPWAYLIDTSKATGWDVPQLYFKDFPFGPSNMWGAPILFDFTTSNGNNRAIAINMVDTSTTGTLQATGIEVNVNTPSDRGGDSSGIFVQQFGGGNAVSLYKEAGGNGFAIETRANGNNHAIFATSENGRVLHAKVVGDNGQGVVVSPTSDTHLDRRAISVTNANNTQEKFYVDMNGTAYASSLKVSGFIQSQDNLPFSVKRYIGNLDASGKRTIEHGISLGHQMVLVAKGYFRGPSGEMYELDFNYLDGGNMKFDGGQANAPYRITVIYSNVADNW